MRDVGDEALVLFGQNLQESICDFRPAFGVSRSLVRVEALVCMWSAWSTVSPARMSVEPIEQPIAKPSPISVRAVRASNISRWGCRRGGDERISPPMRYALPRPPTGPSKGSGPRREKQGVAGRAAEGAVVGPGAVEVEDPDGDRLLAGQRRGSWFQVGEQFAAVAEPSQAVGVRFPVAAPPRPY